MATQRVVEMGPQAKKVLELGVQGFSDKEIAKELGMKPVTVTTHFARLFVRFGAANRCQLAHMATREGLADEGRASDEAIAFALA